jgi:hypothetical protein
MPIGSNWVLQQYGVSLPAMRTFPLATRSVTQVGDSRLFLDAREIAYCDGQLLGVVALANDSLILCERELLAVNESGQLLERIQKLDGLPQGLQRIGHNAEQAYLQSMDNIYRFDWRNLGFDKAGIDQASIKWSESAELPSMLHEQLLHQFAGNEINVERLLLDLHSGRFFGDVGVYVIDAAALLFCFLALSGLWVWIGAKYRRRRSR